MKKKIFILGFLVICILLGFFLFIEASENENIEIKEINNLNECNNLDLINTSYCFRDYTSNFFKYNNSENFFILENNEIWLIESNKIKSLYSEEQFMNYVIKNGGVCYDWAIYYLKLCEKTNFDCELIIENRKIFGHSYLIMSDDNNYCELDQLNVKCGKIENE
jgi:hypothetical protein